MIKKRKTILTIAGIIILCLLAFGGWRWWENYNLANQNADTANTYKSQAESAKKSEAGLKTELEKTKTALDKLGTIEAEARKERWKWSGVVVFDKQTTEKIREAIVKTLTLDPEYWDYPGDKNNKEELEKWVADETDKLIKGLAESLTAKLEEWNKAKPPTAATGATSTPSTSPGTQVQLPQMSSSQATPDPGEYIVKPAQEAASTPATSAPETVTSKVAVKKAVEVTETLKLAIVQEGEGIEHTLIRQLVASPKNFGFEGNESDKKAIKAWAGKKAHQIAILAGYVDLKTGSEVRIKGSGGNVAYLLQKSDPDGKIQVASMCKNKEGNFPDIGQAQPDDVVKIQKLADNYQSANFIGNIVGGLRTYEYPKLV